jgi:cell division protein FtsW
MRISVDRGILLAVVFLLGLGLVQVYSSGYIFAIENYDDGLYFVRRQLVFVVLSLATLLLMAHVPWRWFEKYGFLIFGAAAAGVALTYIPGLGVKVGGAHRWLQFPGGIRFEPSELLKVSFPLMLATLFIRYEAGLKKKTTDWGFWAISIAAIGVPFVLLLKQPDFGSFAICTIVLFGLLFAFGLKWRYVISLGTVAATAFYWLIINVPYRHARLKAFLDPWADPEQKGFQVIQSLLSFYSGGVTGTGLGQGQGKLFFLPEAHTDFTLAVLSEEMGFVGVVIVLCLFGFLVFRGLQIAANAKDDFARLVALGITLTIALACFINAGVAMGLLPTKGLALPFLSYGGSSLLCTCFAIGLLLNIDRQTRQGFGRKSFSGLKPQ